MARNNLQKLTPRALAGHARRFYNVASQNPGEYGLEGFDLQALEEAAQEVERQNAGVFRAKDAYHSAVLSRRAAQEELVRRLSSAANRVYAAPKDDSASVASLGLSVHSTSKARIVPQTPKWVTIQTLPYHRARLKFSRSGNAEGVIFQVETLVHGGNWRHVCSVTRTRVDVEAAAGVPAFFRVIATKNGVHADPSGIVSVYGS